MRNSSLTSSTTIRLLIITNTLSKNNLGGGVEVVVKHHARGLSNLGINVEVLATTSHGISADDLNLGFKCSLIPSKQLVNNNPATAFSFNYFRQLFRLSRNVEFVHLHLCKDLVTICSALLLRLMRKSFAIQTHGVFSRTDRMRDRFFNALARSVANGASMHFILTSSEEIWFSEQNWKTKRLKIRNPVPVISEIKKSLTEYDLVYLSRFQARKRPQLFIEGTNLVLQTFPSLRCRMSGMDQGEYQKCAELINSLGLENSIELTKEIPSDEILEILGKSKLMVLPSYSEYVPMIILESLMLGIPIIVGSDCELAAELQSLGLCSFADNANELSREAIYLIENASEYHRRSLAGRSWVIQNCSVESVCKQLNLCYQEILSESEAKW